MSRGADSTAPPSDHGRVGRLLLAVAVGVAFILHTGGLRFPETFYGDLSYHRGVAYTMAGGSVHGEGPFAGLPSYYGGAFPLVAGWVSALADVGFDTVITVSSWIVVPAMPLLFYGLIVRLWGDPLRAGAGALLATVLTAVSGSVDHGWANGIFAASANEWPLFPRDVGLLLVLVAWLTCIRDGELDGHRVWLTGAIVGIAITVHLQVGGYGLLVIAAWVATSNRRRWPRNLVVLAGSAAVVSVWWWLPRMLWTVEHGLLSLGSRPSIAMSATDVALSLGWVMVLLPAAIVLGSDRDHNDRFVLGWLAALVPLAILTSFKSDLGLITQRRVLFFAGIPLLLVCSAGLAAVARRSRLLALVLVLAMTVTASREARAARTFVDDEWKGDEYGFVQYPSDGWSRNLEVLRERVRDDGGLTVIAGDADGLFIWTQSGAQPHSAWLPGYVKLGFDLESFTGAGLDDRVVELDEAFREGLPGLCELAGRIEASAFLLRTDGAGVGVHDLRPSAPLRSRTVPTDEDDFSRDLGPDRTYRARLNQETLILRNQDSIDVPLAGSEATTIEVHGVARIGEPRGFASLLIDGEEVVAEGRKVGRTLIYRFPDLDLTDVRSVTFSGRRLVEVVRVLGFQNVPHEGELIDGGSVLMEPDEVCPTEG